MSKPAQIRTTVKRLGSGRAQWDIWVDDKHHGGGIDPSMPAAMRSAANYVLDIETGGSDE